VKAVKAISERDFSDITSMFGLPSGEEKGYYSAPPRKDFRVIPAVVTFQKTVYAIIEIE
jgi:hypothetical protein